MVSAIASTAVDKRSIATSLWPGLAVVVVAVAGAAVIGSQSDSIPFIVVAVVAGVLIGNLGWVTAVTEPGLAFASSTVLRAGIVLLGLRLSIGDVADLGAAALVVIVLTVSVTFFGVQALGRWLGLSPALSLLVASGFSICGNSAIASVKAVAPAEEEEVAAAIGLVTLCGTAAIVAVPTLGSVLGLDDVQLGVWTGASVQDTAQVIAVASTAGPAVLAIATAVKLTRVLLLAPIVAGLSLRGWPAAQIEPASRPAILPRFVIGFLLALLARTSGVLPPVALETGRTLEQYALAAGMVGLGSSVGLGKLGRLGVKPMLLGLVAWIIVGMVSLAAIAVLQIGA